jgi:hypothetical protein
LIGQYLQKNKKEEVDMRFTTYYKAKSKVGDYVLNYQKATMTKEEFQSFIVDCLKGLIANWQEFFENYFERVIMDGYDIDLLEVEVDGQVFKMRNEKDFIKVINNIYGDLGSRMLELVKKEIIKEEQN